MLAMEKVERRARLCFVFVWVVGCWVVLWLFGFFAVALSAYLVYPMWY